jgi:hypothetical protein
MTGALDLSLARAPRPGQRTPMVRPQKVVGPSAEVVVTGNSNPDFGLFDGVAKGVK